jgi:multiple sugar transport system permease protein
MITGVRSRGSRFRSTAFGYANLAPFVFFALFPFYFMLITSFKSNAELYSLKSVPLWIQQGAIVDHYQYLFGRTEFLTWIKNSLIISVTSTAISLVIAVLAGYSLARLRFRGVGSFGTAVFITYLVPPTLLFLPLSQVVNWLGISDTIWALIVTYPTFLVPFSTWLLMGYFRTIPREIEECALVDGASRMQTLLRVALPMAIPGIVCVVLFGFTLTWNEFIYALTFVSQSSNKTAIVGVTADLIRGDIYYWGSLMGAALLVGLPVAILYNFFLDRFIQGITGGIGK